MRLRFPGIPVPPAAARARSKRGRVCRRGRPRGTTMPEVVRTYDPSQSRALDATLQPLATHKPAHDEELHQGQGRIMVSG